MSLKAMGYTDFLVCFRNSEVDVKYNDFIAIKYNMSQRPDAI